MENKAPENIEVLKNQASDKLSYKNRLEAVEELGGFKCQQSKDILWRLMIKDKVYSVQELAFRKLQAFGEDVKLPRKQKGHLVKDINKKIEKVFHSIIGGCSPEAFNKKFHELYPEDFDIYSFEKGEKFQQWIESVISSIPKARA